MSETVPQRDTVVVTEAMTEAGAQALYGNGWETAPPEARRAFLELARSIYVAMCMKKEVRP